MHTPVLLGIGIWFLYDVLGWSAFVGLSAIVILFPVPGYVAKLIQTVQKERMQKVCIYTPVISGSPLTFRPQTDARVESVTESEPLNHSMKR